MVLYLRKCPFFNEVHNEILNVFYLEQLNDNKTSLSEANVKGLTDVTPEWVTGTVYGINDTTPFTFLDVWVSSWCVCLRGCFPGAQSSGGDRGKGVSRIRVTGKWGAVFWAHRGVSPSGWFGEGGWGMVDREKVTLKLVLSKVSFITKVIHVHPCSE